MTPPLTPAQRRALLWLPKDGSPVCAMSAPNERDLAELCQLGFRPNTFCCRSRGACEDDPFRFWLTERGKALRTEIENA